MEKKNPQCKITNQLLVASDLVSVFSSKCVVEITKTSIAIVFHATGKVARQPWSQTHLIYLIWFYPNQS